MLTFEDCVEVADLTADEVDAIAEHEHLPELVACEMGVALMRRPGGTETIRGFIEEGIVAARRHRDSEKAEHLRAVLANFDAAHPHS